MKKQYNSSYYVKEGIPCNLEGRETLKVLLAAMNAKYIHSNLAIYSLRTYAHQYEDVISLKEYSINQYTDYIIQDIYKQKPDILLFSCYIWNIVMIEEVAEELHKLLPNTIIWLGGPEVSYHVTDGLLTKTYIDGIMIGEGEETFFELMKYYVDGIGNLREIKGIAYKTNPLYKKYGNERELGEEICQGKDIEQQIKVTESRKPISLSSVPFPYKRIDDFKNKILYYETSRGCPYSCSYCLSSIDKRIRLRGMELVRKELDIFLASKIPQVKFIDRTFNCNHEHAMAIWNYIKLHDNGVTNFHFEISADLLQEEELRLLNTFRPGLAQLEIGVQSTNPVTIEAIHRKMNLEKLKYAVQRIKEGKNIHQHLDLIAGLPYEDYESFRHSFHEVYQMKPEQLQLGFLKVLKGASIYEECKKNGMRYKSLAPYEVLYTKWLPYEKVIRLKQVEDMVEVYYNSHQFKMSISYLEHFYTCSFDLFEELGMYYEEMEYDTLSHSRMRRYEILLEFCKQRLPEEAEILKEILVYDMYLRENMKSRPVFARDYGVYKELYYNFYQKEEYLHQILLGYESYDSKQISRMTHLEYFSMEIERAALEGKKNENEMLVLFDYKNRDVLNYEARTIQVKI